MVDWTGWDSANGKDDLKVSYPGGNLAYISDKWLVARCKVKLLRLRIAQPLFWLASLIAGTGKGE